MPMRMPFKNTFKSSSRSPYILTNMKFFHLPYARHNPVTHERTHEQTNEKRAPQATLPRLVSPTLACAH